MSFGLSRGRELVTEGIGLTMDDLPPLETRRFDPRDWFQQDNRPLEIEIGSGKGTFLVQQAGLQPATNFLGIEWAGEFYRYAADRLRRHQLTNVRILRADATEFIHHWVADGIAQVIHLYFSDPWPKKRHHKRRVVQDESLHDFHRILRPGGELRLVTDHDDLWTWYEHHVARHTNLFERTQFTATESAAAGEMVGSNFERKYSRERRPFHAMTLMRG